MFKYLTSIFISPTDVQGHAVLVPEAVIVIIPGPKLGVVPIIPLFHHNITIPVETNAKIVKEAEQKLKNILF